MANSLGTLNNGTILTQVALEYLRKALFRIGIATTDFSATPAKKGEGVVAHIATPATVNDFGTGAVDVTSTPVTVTINQHKEVHETFTADELNKSARQLVRERIAPQLDAIADYITAQVAALFTVANFPTETVEALVDIDHQTIIELRRVMNARGARGRKNLIVNSSVYANLLKDTVLTSANNSTRNDGVVNDGELRGVFGFDSVVEYPDLPTAENLLGVAVTPAAAVIAVRPPNDPRSAGDDISYAGKIAYVTDPETGFTVMLNEYIDQASLSRSLRMIFLFGVAKGNAGMAERLVSVANP